MKKTKKEPNVYRIDIEPSDEFPERHPTHGWQVRIRRAGVQHTKFFSDEKFGGDKGAALTAAMEYRDKLLPELPEKDDPTIKSAQARSRTGVIGLSFCKKDDGSGTQKDYVQLSWTDNDRKRRTASFSKDKWGLEEAVRNACERLHRERVALGRNTADVETMFERAYTKIIADNPHLAPVSQN